MKLLAAFLLIVAVCAQSPPQTQPQQWNNCFVPEDGSSTFPVIGSLRLPDDFLEFRRGGILSTHLAYSPNGRYVAAFVRDAGLANFLFVWDMDRPQARPFQLPFGTAKVDYVFEAGLVFLPDSSALATATMLGFMYVWDVRPASSSTPFDAQAPPLSLKLRYNVTLDMYVTALVPSADSSFFLASNSRKSSVRMIDAASGALVHEFLNADGASVAAVAITKGA